MGNVNSLANKTDELAALVKNVRIYRECSLLYFTQTWLMASIPDANMDLPGFTTVTAERDTKASGKRKGGTYYMPRKFSHTIAVSVYIL